MLRRLTSEHLSRIVAFGLSAAVLAGAWDIWWHVGIGRDTFWEPPHILLYGAVWCAIVAGIVGWRKHGDLIWKRLGWTLAIVPLLAPFDELWHRMFGVENLMTPFIIWAPPHVLLILSLFTALLLVVPAVRKDGDPSLRGLQLLLVYAAALQLMIILSIPFNPIGAYHIAGTLGTLPMAFAIAYFFLRAAREIPEKGTPIFFAAIFLVFVTTGIEDRTAPEILIPAHEHFPPWLSVLSYLIPACALACLERMSSALKGAVIGALWALVAYGSVPFFYKELEPYGSADALTMIFAAAAGGMIAGWCVGRMRHMHSS